MDFTNVDPTRQLQGGERFRVTLEEKRSFFGARPILAPANALLEAYWSIDRSRFFYTSSGVPLNPDRVLTVNVRTRLEAAQNAISVGEAFTDMQRAIGSWVDVFRVTAQDVQEAADVQERAREEQRARDDGAGEGALGGLGRETGDVIGSVFKEAKNLSRIIVFGLVAVAAIVVVNETRKAV